MKTYTRTSDDAQDRIKQLLKFHPQLTKHKVRIETMMVNLAEDEDGAVLKAHGYPATALAKIIPQEQRAAGRGDCVILIDQEEYNDLSEPQRNALLDHELEHFQVVERDGKAAWDGQERPKMRIKPHDVQVGWFLEVAKRHGENSIEVIQAKRIFEKSHEDLLPGFEFLAKGGQVPLALAATG